MADPLVTIQQYPAPADGIVSRVINDEAILVQAEQGKVKVLNELGARIWTLADGAHTVQQIAAQLCREYQVSADEAQADTLKFIADLVERGMLKISDQPVVPGG